MAYPSLSELLAAYQAQAGGAGPAIAAGREGFTQGANLATQVTQNQAMNEYKKQLLAQKIKEATSKAGQTEEKIGLEKEKIEAPKKQYSVASGITAPEGKIAVIDQTTGKVEYQDLPGAKSSKDVVGSLADVRAKQALSHSLLDDPNYRKNQDIIDRGLRIENISSTKDIIDNPAALHVLNDLIVAQAEGGKASLAGVTKVANETAQQYASRVLEKIMNEPVSTNASAFIKQIKNISNQDMKSAYTSIDALAHAKGNALKRVYPDRSKAIDEVSGNFADDYITGVFGGKKPGFLKGGGAKGKTTEETPASTESSSTASVKTADDFLRKYGFTK